MSSILDKIFAAKRIEVDAQRERVPLAALEQLAARSPAPRSFSAAMGTHSPALIAEIKRASPSRGDILPGLDPAGVALEYAKAGAAALSVLTDVHFKGSLADLEAARAVADLPILRKDFVFDPYQVFEARAAGADCVLLIAAMLEAAQLRALSRLAQELGLAALVEVHNEVEFAIARDAGADLIGINNRDLHTFRTDLATTERLLADFEGGALIVAESGINTPADLRRLYAAGARAFLVGESLLRDGQPGAALRDLMGALRG